MRTNSLRRVAITLGLTFAMLPLSQHAALTATGKKNHHDARALLGDKPKTDGNHVVDRKGQYTVSFDTKGGKIAQAHVRHATKGEIPVKKYRTNKKMVMMDPRVSHGSVALVRAQYETTGYVGYSYIGDDGNEEIYWVPATLVIDPDTGAVEYVET